MVSKFSNFFASELCRLRREANMTQSDVAAQFQLLGFQFTHAEISKIENGKREIYALELVVFAEIFQLDLNSIAALYFTYHAPDLLHERR